MERKLRLWGCSCCGRCWSRSKNNPNPPFPCPQCNLPLVAKRTWPISNHKCKHIRVEESIRDFQRRVWTKPRTAGQREFKSNSKLRSLWNDVRAAKTVTSLLRRSQSFVDAVAEYANDNRGEGKRVRWTKVVGADGKIYKSIGSIPAPTIKLDITINMKGQYVYADGSLELDHYILINPRPHLSHSGDRRLYEYRDTILHEVLHYLDNLAGIEDSDHGTYWLMRLDRMREMFPRDQIERPQPESRAIKKAKRLIAEARSILEGNGI